MAVEIESSTAGRKRRIEMEDLSNVEFETSEEVEVLQTFDKMGLKK
jgi:ATP-dependent RNA helicase